VASSFGLAFAVGRHMLNGQPTGARQPFGPFLAAGVLLTWIAERQFLYFLEL
jgi:hypothetical protein